ncbi:cytidine deaminase [Spiroplasma sp. DGKH1]|uniref:cytidine deaminase n=1 Tax=Spiroplasma sp. DGKH1 TaxID=3050074 RepID=UPI0034C6879A
MSSWFDKLNKLKDHAYVPYSQFHVACICELTDGQTVMGVNVENAAYPVGLCAERTALSQVYTLGYQKKDIKKLYLYTDSHHIGSPCGMCRQFIFELVGGEVEIEIYNQGGESLTIKVADLLPYGFTSGDLS